MMNGSIQNRDSFLDNIAANLKRSRRTGGVVKPQWKHAPQHESLPQLFAGSIKERA